jgi:hypothetical protein
LLQEKEMKITRRAFLRSSVVGVGIIFYQVALGHDRDSTKFESSEDADAAIESAQIRLAAQATGGVESLGRWVGPHASNDVVPIHLSVLPSGNDVLFFGHFNKLPLIVNPSTFLIRQGPQLNFTPFCGANIHLPDGSVAVIGGHDPEKKDNPLTGTNTAIVFSRDGSTYSTVPKMNAARYYPGATTLEDGTILVMGGYDDNEVVNKGAAGFESECQNVAESYRRD